LACWQAGEHGGPGFPVAADAALADQGADLLAGEPAGPLGRAESFGVKDVGDLLIRASRFGELGDAGQECRIVRQLVQAGDGADGVPGGLVPAGPGDGDIDQLAGPGDRDGDVLDQDAQQFLAVGLGGGRGVPDPRQVAGQGLDGRALRGAERLGLLFGEPLVVGLQPAGFGEGGLPFFFPAAGRPGGSEISSGSCDRLDLMSVTAMSGQHGAAQLQFELQFISVQSRSRRST